MSKMNIVELVGKRRTDAGVGNEQKGFLTEQAFAAAVGSTSVLHLSKEDLEKLIIGALRAAPAELTDEEICAVVALRNEIEINRFLEQLLLDCLDRTFEARMNDKNGPLMVSNFSFRRFD